MLKHLLLCLLVNLVFAKAVYNKRSNYLKYKTEFDGFLCKDPIFQLNSDSPIQCGLFCQTNQSCKSVFFDKDSRMCTGCDSRSNEKFFMDKDSRSTLFYEISRDNPDATTTVVTTTTTSKFTLLSPSGRTHFTTSYSLVTAEFTMTTDPPTTSEFATSTDPHTAAELMKTTEPSRRTDFVNAPEPHPRDNFITTTQRLMEFNNTRSGDLHGKLLADGSWGIFNNSRYKILNGVDFQGGTNGCVTKGSSVSAHLAWIDSHSENMLLAEPLGVVSNGRSDLDRKAFIGLQIDLSAGLRRVPSSDFQSDFYNGTLTRYPTPGTEHCVVISSSGDWSPMDCLEVIAAICEEDLD